MRGNVPRLFRANFLLPYFVSSICFLSQCKAIYTALFTARTDCYWPTLICGRVLGGCVTTKISFPGCWWRWLANQSQNRKVGFPRWLGDPPQRFAKKDARVEYKPAFRHCQNKLSHQRFSTSIERLSNNSVRQSMYSNKTRSFLSLFQSRQKVPIHDALAEQPIGEPNGSVVEVTAANFYQVVINSPKDVLIEFYTNVPNPNSIRINL